MVFVKVDATNWVPSKLHVPLTHSTKVETCQINQLKSSFSIRTIPWL